MRNMHKRNNLGFTLIELMVAVAILALLAAVAYPAYTAQIRKAKRSTVITDILSCASTQERRYTLNATYQASACDNIDNDDYTITVELPTRNDCNANGKRNCFTITAAPSTAFMQEDGLCVNFSIDHLGDKQVTGTGDLADCWRT